MNRVLWGVLSGCLLVAPLSLGASVDVERIVAQNLGAVVVIHGTRDADGAPVQGSGCVIHPDGYILATAHQAVGVSSLEAKFSDGAKVKLRTVTVKPDVEFALFKAERPLPKWVIIGDAGVLRGGAPLISIASPISLEFITVSGTVANPDKTYNGYPVVLASLTATHGSSGGPVFDQEGKLIGLISGGLNEVDFTIVNKINNAFPLLREQGLIQGPDVPEAEADSATLVPVAGITEAELRAIEAYNRGVLSTDLDKKMESYALAATLLPKFYEAHFNLAVAEERSGATDEATASYRKAEALRPDALEVKRNLGRLFLKGKAYGEAIEEFQEALALAPNESQSHNDLGEAFRRSGNAAEAIQHFQASLAMNNSVPNVHFNLALAFANNKQSADAVRHFQAYLALYPDAPDAANVEATIKQLQSSVGE